MRLCGVKENVEQLYLSVLYTRSGFRRRARVASDGDIRNGGGGGGGGGGTMGGGLGKALFEGGVQCCFMHSELFTLFVKLQFPYKLSFLSVFGSLLNQIRNIGWML